MGTTSLSFDPFGGGGGPAAPVIVDPFAGMTPVGIQVPTGDPAAIAYAAAQAKSLAALWQSQHAVIRDGALTALDGWTGQAASAFTDFVVHMMGCLAGNADAVATAAGAMGRLGGELDAAQRMIEALVREAEQQQRAQQRAANASTTHAGNLATLRSQQQAGAGVMSPAAEAHLDSQITSEEGAKATADNAESAAARELADTKAQAARLYAEYETAAEEYGRAIQAAADQIVGLPLPAGGAPSPVTVSNTDRAAALALLVRIADAHSDDSPAEWIRLANGGRSPSPSTLVALFDDSSSVHQPPHVSWWDSFTDGLGLDTSGPTNTPHSLGIFVGTMTLGAFGGEGEGDPDPDPDGDAGDDAGGPRVARDLTYSEQEHVAQFDRSVDSTAVRLDHQAPTGGPTIPSDWGNGQPTDKPGGAKWLDPENPKANGVRVMPAQPDSPNPAQRVPYVKVISEGGPLDADGNPLRSGNADDPEAHIPRLVWERWRTWNAP